MEKHLNNILKDISTFKRNNKFENYQYNLDEIIKTVTEIKECIVSNNYNKINFIKLRKLENLIYDLNLNNLFSSLTDQISNNLYAFEFLLEERLKENK